MILNRTATRTFLLELAARTGRPFVRVSTKTIDQIEAEIRAMLARKVHAAPGRKTL